MNPGIARHNEEWARFWRRLSLVAVIASVVFAAPFLWLMRSPDARRALNDPKRFGFSGDEQYVRRIQLSALGAPRGARSDSRMIRSDALAMQQKGGGTPARLDDAGLTPAPRPTAFRPPGSGDSEEDILARAMLRAGDTPLFQSRELVITELVEPVYPPEARERGIEGRVAIMALVDTTGAVLHAEIVGTADHVLELAAMDAVMQCRFEPYAVEGRAREVYAMFRFAFRLLN
jgi:TonB family protein